MLNSKLARSSRKPAARIRSERKAAMGLSPDFPLFPLGSDDQPHRLRWAKKVRGKLRYFGKVIDDPKGERALQLWLDQKDDLLAGRTPRNRTDGIEIRDLCHHFLTSKLRLLKTGEITPRTFHDYHCATDRIVAAFGERRLVSDLNSADFDKLRADMAKTLGVVALSNAIQRVRSVFQYGFNAELLEKPLRLAMFKRPSKKSIRLARAEKGPRLFEAPQLRKLIKVADVQIKAMVLLAVNGGLGNSDIANMPLKALDLNGGWLNYPRPKTGIGRRIPLWPETVAAVKAAISKRPAPKVADDAELVFITKHGHSWGKLGRFDGEIDLIKPPDGENRRKGISSNNSLSKEFRKLAEDAGVQRTFYDLRHTFRTIGDEAKDQPAVNSIMGHADESMAANYRERIADERLRAVADYVRAWLYSESVKDPRANSTRRSVKQTGSAKTAPRSSTSTSPGKRATAVAAHDDDRPALRIVG